MGFDKHNVSCIHCYRSVLNSFIPLKNLLCFTEPSSPTTTGLFTVSIIFSFPECHTNGIISCVGCSHWLVSLSNMHLRFIYVFGGLISHSIFFFKRRYKKPTVKVFNLNYNSVVLSIFIRLCNYHC